MCPRRQRDIVRHFLKFAVLIVITIALVFFINNSCSQPGSTNTPIPVPTTTPIPTKISTPQTRLEVVLSWVPLDYSNKLIEFSDHASSSLVTGVPIPHSYQEYEELDERQRDRLFEGTAWSYPIVAGRDREFLEEEFNYLIWEYDLGIWSEFRGGRVPRFMIFDGISDKDGVLRGLVEQGYEETTYNGTPYWRIHEDFRYDIRRHPMRVLQSSWNRVSMMDNRILTAPATSIIENLIDLQKKESASLLESPPHWILSRTIGEGLIGGVFATPAWIAEHAVGSFRFSNRRRCSPTTVGVCEWFSDALDMHLTGPDVWDKLSPYTVALIGYRAQDGVEETIIALHYSDPKAARRDAGELEKRWNTFHLQLEERIPITDSCSPLSTRIEEHKNSAVLLAMCPVIRGTEESEARVFGPDLWRRLYLFGNLEFLALDLEEQKQLAGERAEEERAK